MKILGISAFYHDSAACIIDDGMIKAAAQEERFTRVRYDPSFPANAVKYCLSAAGITAGELDAVVFYDKPWLKFERLLETYYIFAPRGAKSFAAAMPVWIKDKLFLRSLLQEEMAKLGLKGSEKINLLFSEHHLSHAASAFYPSPYAEAAVLTMDGAGEWSTASIARASEHGITILREMRFPHSAGLLYSAFTYYLGFRVNSGEYKLMGLSPYGDPSSADFKEFVRLIRDNIVDIKDDGSLFLDQGYFDYCAGLKMVNNPRWEKLFGFPKREAESVITQQHCNFALAAQKVTEEIVLRMGKTARELTGSDNLVMAGGVALNCVANSRLLEAGLFRNIWVQPAAGDAGGALGAALAAYHIYFGAGRNASGKSDGMCGSLLGPFYDDKEIEAAAAAYGAKPRRFPDKNSLYRATAEKISSGAVVGWFQGRMEWGPRALGNRSILGDARKPEMQKRLNLSIKRREAFRPFAPSVLSEDTASLFSSTCSSPYMLFTFTVNENIRKPLPEGYSALPLMEKLYISRSEIPAVTHIDNSARIQTVDKVANPEFWGLLKAFKTLTGCPALINTSFNVRGEPIVCSPEDACRCFINTDMDYLVMGNYFFEKKDLHGTAAGGNATLGLTTDKTVFMNITTARKILFAFAAVFAAAYFIFRQPLFAAAGSLPVAAALFGGKAALISARALQRSSVLIADFNARALLVIAYYLILTPIAVLYRLFNRKSSAHFFTNSRMSYFEAVENKYVKDIFGKPW